MGVGQGVGARWRAVDDLFGRPQLAVPEQHGIHGIGLKELVTSRL